MTALSASGSAKPPTRGGRMKTREEAARLLQRALETDDDDLLEEAIEAGRELDAADEPDA